MVRDFYAALGRRDYRAAHQMWSGGRGLDAFRRGFAQTVSTQVTTLPPYVIEGAAGSSYAKIRVRVDARLKDGTAQRFVGSYTLRRVNEVDGASAAARRWHIIGATLRATPAGG